MKIKSYPHLFPLVAQDHFWAPQGVSMTIKMNLGRDQALLVGHTHPILPRKWEVVAIIGIGLIITREDHHLMRNGGILQTRLYTDVSLMVHQGARLPDHLDREGIVRISPVIIPLLLLMNSITEHETTFLLLQLKLIDSLTGFPLIITIENLSGRALLIIDMRDTIPLGRGMIYHLLMTDLTIDNHSLTDPLETTGNLSVNLSGPLHREKDNLIDNPNSLIDLRLITPLLMTGNLIDPLGEKDVLSVPKEIEILTGSMSDHHLPNKGTEGNFHRKITPGVHHMVMHQHLSFHQLR